METARAGCLGADSPHRLATTEREHIGEDIGHSSAAILGPTPRSVEGIESNGETRSPRKVSLG
jgi:hypothetical protein